MRDEAAAARSGAFFRPSRLLDLASSVQIFCCRAYWLYERKSRPRDCALPDELLDRLDRACEITVLDASRIVKACIKAFVEEIDRTGEIRLPLPLVAGAKNRGSSGSAGGGKTTGSTSGRRHEKSRERFKRAGEEDIGLAGERWRSSKEYSGDWSSL
jgi:hypothetical protein